MPRVPEAAQPLADVVDQLTVEAAPELVREEAGGKVRCLACGHRCLVMPGLRGICQVRINRDGRLRVPFGYVGALQSDPTEKKPFFHVLPGSRALSFRMLGCDLHCPYCQNWLTSQALRDEEALIQPRRVSAARLADLALETGAEVIASSYNEPLITSEWAAAVMREGRRRGRMTDRDATAARQLVRAAEIGEEEGLRYVYCGNQPGRVGRYEDTRCHGCGATLIRRHGYQILEDRLTPTAGRCPACATEIPGRWRRPEPV